MKTKLVALASLAIVGAVVVVVRARTGTPHHPRSNTTSVHATGVDQADTSVSLAAMLNAPDAASPCETAFAAVEAEQAAAKLRGTHSIFQWVAPATEFVATCRTLPPAAQDCMMPRFRRDHQDDCLRSRPPSDVLKKLMVGVPVAEPDDGH